MQETTFVITATHNGFTTEEHVTAAMVAYDPFGSHDNMAGQWVAYDSEGEVIKIGATITPAAKIGIGLKE